MIQKLKTIASTTTVPYDNIALETYLLQHVEPGTCILYLWQNRQTVVIGRNQNSWKECKCRLLEEEGGYLARRLSGGGAVFHDLGNLNFTFLLRKEDYSVERQTEVILKAARMYGIQAERTGRNDIEVEGQKFSGNAYYLSGDCCCHHGTILIDVDMEAMNRYLNVPKDKLLSKGVDSVRSRVTNLIEYAPRMTIDGMKERLACSCSRVYGVKAETLNPSEIDWKEVESLTGRYCSWEWLYGKKIPFTRQMEHRYPWGGAELQFEVDNGLIQAVNLYSDGMDVELFEQLKDVLPGLRYQTDVLHGVISKIPVGTELRETMKTDIVKLLCKSI